MSTVLVTGGSGFVGSYCILQLLAAGHQVRTTVRSLDREADVRDMLKQGGVDLGGVGPVAAAAGDRVEASDRLSFFAANLESDEGWTQAVAGCEYVLHVASPFPVGIPKHEDELIIPARDGTLRVLRASRDSGVKRVVLTSSFAAIGYGHKSRERPFDETDWTNLTSPKLAPYVKSKTLAERAAWDFVAREGRGLELAVINPVAIFGPVLGPDYSTSIGLLRGLTEGSMRAVPRLYFGVVDVRDVADLHIRAMTSPAARGERFLAIAGDCMSVQDMARVLKAHLGPAGSQAPTRQAPDWLIRIAALRNPTVRPILSELGKIKRATSAKAARMLGWSPRSNEAAIIATADSLVALAASPYARGAQLRLQL